MLSHSGLEKLWGTLTLLGPQMLPCFRMKDEENRRLLRQSSDVGLRQGLVGTAPRK